MDKPGKGRMHCVSWNIYKLTLEPIADSDRPVLTVWVNARLHSASSNCVSLVPSASTQRLDELIQRAVHPSPLWGVRVGLELGPGLL